MATADIADIKSASADRVFRHMLEEVIEIMQETANGTLFSTGAHARANPEEALAVAAAVANITSRLARVGEWLLCRLHTEEHSRAHSIPVLGEGIAMPLMRNHLPPEIEALFLRCNRLYDRAHRLSSFFANMGGASTDSPAPETQAGSNAVRQAQSKLSLAYPRERS